MEKDNSISPKEMPSRFELKAIYQYSLKYWYIYILCFVGVYIASKLYIRYAKPQYLITASVFIKDEKKRLGADQFLEGMELLNTAKSVQNEIEIIKSYNNVYKTLESLDFEVSYFVEGDIKTIELYNTSHINVDLDSNYSHVRGVPFYIEIENDSVFSIFTKAAGNKLLLSSDESGEKQLVTKGVFGKVVKCPYFKLIVKKSPNLTEKYKQDQKFYFVINDMNQLTLMYSARLKVEMINKYSTILKLSVMGPVAKKDVNFLNSIMHTYIQSGLNDKNQIVLNTINFIDAQLLNITDSLKGTEQQLEKYRSDEQIVDLNISAEQAISSLSALEEERAMLLVKDRYYRYLLEYIESNDDIHKIVAPSAVGISDPLLNKLIDELYVLHAEQSNLVFSANTKNPTYQMLEVKIQNTRKALIENLRSLIQSSDIFLKDNQKRIDGVKGVISQLPRKERNLINIQRKYMLNDYIYNYLLQKRMEAYLAKVANVADNKVVNAARVAGMISPNIPAIRNVSIFLGIFLPLGIILIILFFRNKIDSKDLLLKLTNVPLLGSVYHYSGTDKFAVLSSSKSRLAESIRSIRINLQYLASTKTYKVVGVSSSVSAEGKSFFSLNLAASIASAGAKVILIGADMRKPRLHSHLGFANERGLSTYLINKHKLQDVIVETEVKGLDVILSGPIPPDPVELLQSSNMEELFTELKKKYEYVIIDTPPLGLVSDYFVLYNKIDVNIFMVRQNYTRYQMIHEMNRLVETRSLQHFFLVLNDVKFKSGMGYGYGYGYGYGSYGSYGYYEENSNNSKGFLDYLKNKFGKKKG